MKNVITALLICGSFVLHAQDFSKDLASARSAYNGGNLENARFAMQQMLNDIDIIVGKELMKSLPQKMDPLALNPANDNVTTGSGFAGVVIHRDYGKENKTVTLDIMTNSPLIASINAILSIPFMGNSGDGSQKVVKVQGYKAVLQKNTDTETGKTDFTLQLPLNSSLITLVCNDSQEAEVLKWANTLPVADIARLIQ